MRRIGRQRVLSCATALLALALSSAPAAAAARRDVTLPSPTADQSAPGISSAAALTDAANWLAGAIALRQSALTSEQQLVSASATLTAADRSSLLGEFSSYASGLTALAAHIPSDTTIALIRADAASMVTSYHVLSLVVPVANDVISIDAELTSAQSDSTQATALEAAITTAQHAKHNVTSLLASDHDLRARLADLQSQVGSLAQTLLSLAPSSWPSPVAALSSAKAAISRANSDLNAVTSDTKAIVRLLATLSSKWASLQG